MPLFMLAAASVPALAQYSFRTETNSDGTLTVYNSSKGGAGQGCPIGVLTIPPAIGDRRVTGIGKRAFELCTGLTRVTISDGVTSIGGQSFAGCVSLTNVAIPESVTNIGDQAFVRCSGLPTITIPGKVKTIEAGTFTDCTNLANATIPEGVIRIGNHAFARSGLTTATIPGSVRTWGGFDIFFGNVIAQGSFMDCPRLTNVTILEGVPFVPSYAFGGCTGLVRVSIPPGVTNIGAWAFGGCTRLNEVNLPDGVTQLGLGAFGSTELGTIAIPASLRSWPGSYWSGGPQIAGAFMGCARLTNVTVLDGVTMIGDQAFRDCTNLTSIRFPYSVTNIGAGAFGGCLQLTAAYFDGNAPGSDGGLAFSNWRAWVGQIPGDFQLTATTMHYLPGTRGWAETFAGRPTTPWVRPGPTILGFGDRFGPSTNGFGFVISWATNVPVVVEASVDIDAGWTPISTNTLTDGWVRFTDLDWKSRSARFYRVRGW